MITSKFVSVKTKQLFESLISTIPQGLDPIVFIEDTKELWLRGTYFSAGIPSLDVSEQSGSIVVSLGNSSFNLSTAGDGLSVRKGAYNDIILTSTALSSINGVTPLKWDAVNKQLIHEDSGVDEGSYGQSNNLTKASTFTIPNITIDAKGHVTGVQNSTINIRDYVEQVYNASIEGEHDLLLSYNSSNTNTDTTQALKGRGVTYNNVTQKLTVAKGIQANGGVDIDGGDLTVTNGYIVGTLKGDVTGSAIPKIHLSTIPEYGGASTELYGHVKVQDALPVVAPPASSDNTNINNAGVEAIAASPKMVWDAVQQMQTYVDNHGIVVTGLDINEEEVDLSDGFKFSQDFESLDKNIYISWKEIN